MDERFFEDRWKLQEKVAKVVEAIKLWDGMKSHLPALFFLSGLVMGWGIVFAGFSYYGR